jgi:hypothetical protein
MPVGSDPDVLPGCNAMVAVHWDTFQQSQQSQPLNPVWIAQLGTFQSAEGMQYTCQEI